MPSVFHYLLLYVPFPLGLGDNIKEKTDKLICTMKQISGVLQGYLGSQQIY